MKQLYNNKKAHVGPSGIVLSCPFVRKTITEIQELGGKYTGSETKLWAMPLTKEAVEFIFNNDFEVDETSLDNLEKFMNARAKMSFNCEKRFAWARSIYAEPIPEVLEKLDTNLFTPAPFQWVPCYYARLTDGNFLLSDPMGAGKTLESVLVTLLPEYAHLPVIVVCPANAVYNWQNELAKMFGYPSYIVTKPTPHLIPRIRFYIVSYQMIRKIGFSDEAFLIVDESAEIKNVKAQRTKNLIARAAFCPHKLLMSGTPTPNRPEEAFAQITVLDPSFMPYDKFITTYCNAKKSPYKWGKDATGHSNLGELHKLLFENYLVRREKKDIMPQLPKKTHQVVHLGEHIVEGESLLEMYANNALMKSVDADFWEWVDMLIDCAEGAKILWFFHHQIMGEAFKQHFASKNMAYKFIDGSVEGIDRQRQVQEFQSDDTQHFILSLMAASTALTLTAAHITVHSELVFSPGVHAQASDRTHRMGQTEECLNYYLLWSKLEHRIWSIHVKKLSVIDQIYTGAALDDDGSDKSIQARIAEEFNVPVMKRKEKKPVSSVMSI